MNHRTPAAKTVILGTARAFEGDHRAPPVRMRRGGWGGGAGVWLPQCTGTRPVEPLGLRAMWGGQVPQSIWGTAARAACWSALRIGGGTPPPPPTPSEGAMDPPGPHTPHTYPPRLVSRGNPLRPLRSGGQQRVKYVQRAGVGQG